jgi:hypothetical protein
VEVQILAAQGAPGGPHRSIDVVRDGPHIESRDASLGARLMEALVLQEIYLSFRQKDADFTEFDYEKGRATWGSLIANVARRNHEPPQAFARKVLAALEARGAQLRFTTWWFGQMYGDPDLAQVGDNRARQLYAARRQRQWKPPEAFKLLVDAFQYESTAGSERSRVQESSPDVQMAEKIERSLLAAIRT